MIFQRNVPVLQIRRERTTSTAVFIILLRRAVQRVVTHQAVRLLDIEAADAFVIGIDDDGIRMVADHLRRIAVPCRKNGQKATLRPLRDQ